MPRSNRAGIVEGSFAAGARVAVHRDLGPTETAVETLQPGDLVPTRSGQGLALKPVRRVGRSVMDPARHPDPGAVTPIRIAAGALGADLPRRDLLLAPEALLLFRDLPDPADTPASPVLVPVGALVNGTSIRRAPEVGALTWHTVGLDGHDAVLVENVAVATHRMRSEGPSGGRPGLFAPMLPPGAALAGLRARLNPGTAPRPPQPADDIPLRLFAAETEIAAAGGMPDGEFRFLLPAGTGPVRLVSPAYDSSAQRDARRLGVCVVGLDLDGAAVDMEGTAPGPGFHPVEANGANRWRWTNGNAWLVLDEDATARTLTVRINDWHLALRSSHRA